MSDGTFSSLLKVHPEYLQIRLIGLAEHGKERVRVERDGKQLPTPAPHEPLQAGDRLLVLGDPGRVRAFRRWLGPLV